MAGAGGREDSRRRSHMEVCLSVRGPLWDLRRMAALGVGKARAFACQVVSLRIALATLWSFEAFDTGGCKRLHAIVVEDTRGVNLPT